MASVDLPVESKAENSPLRFQEKLVDVHSDGDRREKIITATCTCSEVSQKARYVLAQKKCLLLILVEQFL